MLLLVAVSLVVIDEWLANSVLARLPEVILSMATEGGQETMSIGALVTLLVLFFVANGVVGPIAEELYFRGHLLPRIDRYGRDAPVLNTVLFTLYHFHTPWRWPVIFLGYLPICIASWRKRSLWIGLGAHFGGEQHLRPDDARQLPRPVGTARQHFLGQRLLDETVETHWPCREKSTTGDALWRDAHGQRLQYLRARLGPPILTA